MSSIPWSAAAGQAAAANVLNPELYARLVTLYGHVQVANPGVTNYWGTTATLHNGRLYRELMERGETYRVNCNFCGEQRRRLWVNYQYGVPDPSGRPDYSLARCYNETDCLRDSANWYQFKSSMDNFSNEKDRHRCLLVPPPATWDTAPRLLVEPKLPDGLTLVSELCRTYPYHPAVEYMCGERRYTVEALDKYQISYCERSAEFPAVNRRIVFPIYMHNRLQGWQARYIGEPPSKVVQKYYNMPGIRKSQLAYNYDVAKHSKLGVIVEGLPDVHRLGDPAVAIFGSSMSKFQNDLVVMAWAGKPVAVMLDADAIENAKKICASLREQGVDAFVVYMPPHVDASVLTYEAAWGAVFADANQAGVKLP